uniref:NAC domain-containing protein NAC70 n=1 Tax=Medicago sativa subsp. falcata TaxID=3878 RepID=A0A6B7JET9_MEDSF|nr:NAC domain-containing protein NAC70 [Medicago sativa subsp. falcata]
MAREWLINIRGFAKKLRSTTLSSADQIKDCGACRECPNCHCRIDNSDVSSEWPGFPLGIKFDPSDVEILEHLAAKCGVGNIKPHMFIEEFIPTLEGEQGICYTHPENLPGAKKDGSSVHFFHRTMNAYSSGQRKRRKIHHRGSTEDHVRWHKTGKTKAIIEHGEHKGFKKIMVLYIRSEKESKSYKSDWKMHQYHLGTDEDEKNGEYVVSKIFYKQNEKNEDKAMAEEPDSITSRTSPRTPNPNPPNPPRTGKCVDNGNINETSLLPFAEDVKSIPVESNAMQSDIQDQENTYNFAWLAGESQAMENSEYADLDDLLLCDEIFDSSALFTDSQLDTINDLTHYENRMTGNYNVSSETSTAVLDTLELDTPPDYDLSNLTFGSQDDSILGLIGGL